MPVQNRRDKFRSPSAKEVILQSVEKKVKIGKLIILRSISESEINSIFASHMRVAIEDVVRYLKEWNRPRVFANDFFPYQANEEIYYYSKDVTCVVPHSSKRVSNEWYYGGTLIVTNQRIIYSSKDHKQTYRIRNIRDFNFNNPYPGYITVATSEKRREAYQVGDSWFVVTIIMFLWNDQFREMIMTEGIESSINYIFERFCVLWTDVLYSESCFPRNYYYDKP